MWAPPIRKIPKTPTDAPPTCVPPAPSAFREGFEAGVRVAIGHLRHTADDFLLFELLDPTSAHARTFKDNAALLRLIATRIEESTK